MFVKNFIFAATLGLTTSGVQTHQEISSSCDFNQSEKNISVTKKIATQYLLEHPEISEDEKSEIIIRSYVSAVVESCSSQVQQLVKQSICYENLFSQKPTTCVYSVDERFGLLHETALIENIVGLFDKLPKDQMKDWKNILMNYSIDNGEVYFSIHKYLLESILNLPVEAQEKLFLSQEWHQFNAIFVDFEKENESISFPFFSPDYIKIGVVKNFANLLDDLLLETRGVEIRVQDIPRLASHNQ